MLARETHDVADAPETSTAPGQKGFALIATAYEALRRMSTATPHVTRLTQFANPENGCTAVPFGSPLVGLEGVGAPSPGTTYDVSASELVGASVEEPAGPPIGGHVPFSAGPVRWSGVGHGAMSRSWSRSE